MKIRKIIPIICAASLLLTGCMPQYYTQDLLEAKQKEYVEKGTEWFKTQLPEAEVKTMNYYTQFSDIYNMVRGEMSYEGNEYVYILNPEDDALYTDKGYDGCMEYAVEILDQELTFSHSEVKVQKEPWYKIPCKNIRNLKSGFSDEVTDVTENEDQIYERCLPWNYTEDDARQWIKSLMESNTDSRSEMIGFEVEVQDFDCLFEDHIIRNIMEKYDGIDEIKFYIKDTMDKEYFTVYSDSKRTITHHYENDEGEWEYKDYRL